MIVLHASASIKPEARERWFALLDAVTPPSRAEEACRSYVVYEAVETPDKFLFVEEWASLDGLHAHFQTPHFTEFFAGFAEVIAEPPAGTVSEVSSTQTLAKRWPPPASADRAADQRSRMAPPQGGWAQACGVRITLLVTLALALAAPSAASALSFRIDNERDLSTTLAAAPWQSVRPSGIGGSSCCWSRWR